ncbi:hypothetical protein RRG08_048195, partial [Elysia crispata]
QGHDRFDGSSSRTDGSARDLNPSASISSSATHLQLICLSGQGHDRCFHRPPGPGTTQIFSQGIKPLKPISSSATHLQLICLSGQGHDRFDGSSTRTDGEDMTGLMAPELMVQPGIEPLKPISSSATHLQLICLSGQGHDRFDGSSSQLMVSARD